MVESVGSSGEETEVRILLQKVLGGGFPLRITYPTLRGIETVRLRGAIGLQTDLVVRGEATTRPGVVEPFMTPGVSSKDGEKPGRKTFKSCILLQLF